MSISGTLVFMNDRPYRDADRTAFNAPKGLRVRICRRSSRWWAMVEDRATDQVLLEEKVPNLDYGVWLLTWFVIHGLGLDYSNCSSVHCSCQSETA